MTYSVRKHNNQYHIIEKDTGYSINIFKTQDKARELCRSLNLGSGFDGYTPAFFLEDFKQKERPPTK